MRSHRCIGQTGASGPEYRAPAVSRLSSRATFTGERRAGSDTSGNHRMPNLRSNLAISPTLKPRGTGPPRAAGHSAQPLSSSSISIPTRLALEVQSNASTTKIRRISRGSVTRYIRPDVACQIDRGGTCLITSAEVITSRIAVFSNDRRCVHVTSTRTDQKQIMSLTRRKYRGDIYHTMSK